MPDIEIKMKDGTVRQFLHEGRPGGRFTKTLRLECGFVVIEDEYFRRTIIPAADVAEIVEWPNYG